MGIIYTELWIKILFFFKNIKELVLKSNYCLNNASSHVSHSLTNDIVLISIITIVDNSFIIFKILIVVVLNNSFIIFVYQENTYLITILLIKYIILRNF